MMDTTAAGVPAAAPAPDMSSSLAVRAGTWEGRSMLMDQDSVISTWRMVATADTTGWTVTFPNGEPIPIHVIAVEGDSVVTEFGPYESPITPGQMRMVRTVGRMDGDRQTGTFESRLVAQPDSILRGRWEATRAP